MMTSLIPKDDVTRDTIAEGLRAVGLVLHPTPAAEDLTWDLWMTADQRNAVHYIDDLPARVRYLSVHGSRHRQLAKRVRLAVPIWEHEELLERALSILTRGTEDEIARAAMEVATEMDVYDAASAGVLTTFLLEPDRPVRLAAALALRTRPHPMFHGRAEKLAADPDPEIAAIGKEWLSRILARKGK